MPSDPLKKPPQKTAVRVTIKHNKSRISLIQKISITYSNTKELKEDTDIVEYTAAFLKDLYNTIEMLY